MLTTEELLTMDAESAVKRQVSMATKARLPESAIKLIGLRQDIAEMTWAYFQLEKAGAPVDLWGLEGIAPARYRRFNTHDFFNGVDRRVKVSLPVGSVDVFRTFLKRWKIPLSDSEVLSTQVDSVGQLTIVPSDTSWRWYGPIDIVVDLVEMDINDYVKVGRYIPSIRPDYGSHTVLQELTEWINDSRTNLLVEPVSTDMFSLTDLEYIDNTLYNVNTIASLSFGGIPYSGTLKLEYSRRSFPATYNRPLKISYPQGTTRDLASVLSDLLGCIISPQDIVDEPLPGIGTYRNELMLISFDKNSLGYVGEVWVDYTRIPYIEV